METNLAESLFLEFLGKAEHPAVELESLCQQNEALAPELRLLWEKLTSTIRLLDAYGDGDSSEFGLDVERYQLLGEIARGGMGQVLEVRDLRLGRTLAMKTLLEGDDPRAVHGPGRDRQRRRLLNEAHILGLLEHPSIVPIHELGEDPGGRPYFTMLRVRGRRLDEVFGDVRDGREPWSLTRAVGVLQRVTEAVSHAHARGILHRDLKPQNVMIGPFGEVFVMDWGLAKVRESDGSAALPVPAPTGASEAEWPSVVAGGGLDDAFPESLLTVEGDVVGGTRAGSGPAPRGRRTVRRLQHRRDDLPPARGSAALRRAGVEGDTAGGPRRRAEPRPRADRGARAARARRTGGHLPARDGALAGPSLRVATRPRPSSPATSRPTSTDVRSVHTARGSRSSSASGSLATDCSRARSCWRSRCSPPG